MWRWVLAGLGSIAAIAILDCIGNRVPPQALTHARMHGMKRRILHFAVARGELPKTVAELPRFKGFDNSVVDAWGWPIRMSIEGDKVTLSSYGRDGIQGGSGEDADMVAVFLARDEAGVWADELCKWEIDPYSRKW